MTLAVILAAGASSRLGRPKALLPWSDTTLLGHTIRAARRGGCSDLLVVVGADGRQVAAEAARHAAPEIENRQWDRGMASSIALGVSRADPDRFGAVLLLACDQPRLSPDVVAALLAADDGHPDRMVACAYAGDVGIPALFGRGRWPALCALSGDRGARSVLREDPGARVDVPWPDGEFDVDTPGDWADLGT